jgi:hypothetical protein|tara:strand:- start:104104 stop:104853 length:750 start_codon:yes stop_codon:yes gene_type:complete
MKKLTQIFISCLFFFAASQAWGQARYGERFCNLPDYDCIRIESGDRWETLFPNSEEEDIIRRVNRMNISLKPGMIIAIPKHIENLTIYDVSPFPRYIESIGEKTIYVNQERLAWGAYDAEGQLVWWGPLSSGSGQCNSANGYCKTPAGFFRVIRKQDNDCVSTAFPRHADGTTGGAEMPYCMHFFRGYALHGSRSVPGYRASHGCVRIFIEDARWLNEEFIDLPGIGLHGTRVIVGAPVTTRVPRRNPK